MADRVPRQYQDYIFQRAQRGNVIAWLPTGSGKTYIACLLIQHLAHETRTPFSDGGKRIFFLVPQKVLVKQQADEIRNTTPFSEDVAELTGDNDTDMWTANKWRAHLEQYKIFVLIHDIFKNLLAMGNVLPLDQISLVVFDEVHHAALKRKGKTTGHPYRQILETLSTRSDVLMRVQGHPPPLRLLGLTASLINTRIFSVEEVSDCINDLKKAFLDAECVAVDTVEVFRYKTNARIIVWLCDVSTSLNDSKSMLDLCSKLQGQLEVRHKAFKEAKISFPVECDEAARVIERLSKCITEMSVWVARELCREYQKELEAYLNLYADSFITFAGVLRALLAAIGHIEHHLSTQLSQLTLQQQIIGIASPKLIRLLQLLENYSLPSNSSSPGNAFRAIIFVKTRLEAKAFAHWLQNAAGLLPTLAFVKANYLTGYSSRPGFVDKISRTARQHQQDTMQKFRDGKLNLLVATSVLEEGLDVPECNCVIRYHLPETYRSFQQSMGRARARNAAFYLICATGEEHSKLMKDLEEFQKLDFNITVICKRDKERREEALGLISLTSAVDEAELDEQKVVHEETGAEIKASAAVGRVHEYLAQSSFGWVPRPVLDFQTTIGGREICTVRLPLSSGISDPISGRPMTTKHHAKQSAFLEICRELMRRNLLDKHLLPVPKHVIVDRVIKLLNLEVPREEIAGDSHGVPGTRRRKQMYVMESGDIATGASNCLHLFRLTIRDPASRDGDHCLGLLSSSRIPPQALTAITLHKKNRAVNISFQEAGAVDMDQSSLRAVKWFNSFIFLQMLGFDSSVQDAFDVRPSLLAVPLSRDSGLIDFGYIELLKMKEGQRTRLEFNDQGFGVGRLDAFIFNPDEYTDAAVRPWYGPTQNGDIPVRDLRSWSGSWKVVGFEHAIDDVMGDGSKGTHADYFRFKYGLVASNPQQKLLKVNPGSQLARLTPSTRVHDNKIIHYVPEFCEVCPMSASMWDKVSCLPALLFRLDQLRVAHLFRLFLANFVGLNVDADQCFNEMELANVKIATRSRSDPHASDADSDADISDLPSLKRSLEESDDDEDYQGKRLEAGGGDPVRTSAMEKSFLQRFCNVVRRGLSEPSREPIEYQPDQMFLSSRFQSAVSSVNAQISLRVSREMELSCLASMRLLDEVTIGGGFAASNPILLERQEPSRVLVHDDVNAFQLVSSFDKRLIGRSFPPGLHVEVFSARSAHDVVDSERLETLGDAFLKFAVSSYLHARTFDRSPDAVNNLRCLSEGHLTAIKGQLVSNYNLYRLSKKFSCGQKMFVEKLDPKANWLPPGFKELPGKQCRTVQSISDKAVADSLEALIGAVVLRLGDMEAIKLLSWLGLPVRMDDPQDGHWLPRINPVDASVSDDEMMRSYERSHVSRLEKILNYCFKNKWFPVCAITHSSCCDNWATGSYEKLEFLGDAVLDRLIATFCFEYKRSDGTRLDPGQMTDLRSALVNNAYLGCILVKFDLHKSIWQMAHEVKNQIDNCAENLRSYADESHLTIGSHVIVNSEADGQNVLRPIEVPKILGDVLEAIIGAIYLDSDRSLDAVWRVVHGLMQSELEAFVHNIPKNPIRQIYEADPGHQFLDGRVLDDERHEIKLNFKNKQYTGSGRNRKFARLHAAMNALKDTDLL